MPPSPLFAGDGSLYRVPVLSGTSIWIIPCKTMMSGFHGGIRDEISDSGDLPRARPDGGPSLQELGYVSNSNTLVIGALGRWLGEQRECWLSTVIATWGSSPMPVGSMMAYSAGQGIVGSLSGGCIEGDLVRQMEDGSLTRRMGPAGAPLQITYGETEEERARFRLPCGGRLRLVVERLVPSPEVIDHVTRLEKAVTGRRPVARQVSLTDGALALEFFTCTPGLSIDEERLVQGFVPEYQMLLVGAGEVSRRVAELARNLDFRVFYWDFREEFLRGWDVEGTERVTEPIEKAVRERFSDRYNAIITLAHDPRLDDVVLMDALETDAFYIGALGSERTATERRKRLEQLLDEGNSLDRLHAPVGIPIGSRTPGEIAISVLAEVISARAALRKAV
ncbi:MAG: XdhC family protein [Gammaproteobacteria bacterium]|nr:MAG: XdhC family protein [Gammaproteobacteria bacterium]